MKIRTFETRDKERVVELWQACGLTVPWNDPYKDIQRKLAVDPDLFLVGEMSGEIVASVMGGYEGHRGWINYLAVAPRHQRKGHGRQMMQAVEERIRSRGCPKINLQVRESNTQVIAFYRAIGFKLDHVIGMGKRLEEDEPGTAS